jgi:hypothetical protein
MNCHPERSGAAAQSRDLGFCVRPLMPTHAHLLHGMQIEVEISRGQLFTKKPVQSVPSFATSTELATSH